ncbi:MAG: phosphoglycerate kinase, partial [Nanoarchaeota archaeon]
KNFERGTKEILKAVVKSKVFSIVGGGHSLDAVERYVGKRKISYVSLAGGALLEYMAGKKLPGLIVLEMWARRFDL